MSEAAATASVEVPLEPEVAFEAFTSEIDRWWRPGPLNWYDSERATGTKIEPGVGGRWLELYDADGNDLLEIARITVWEPGIRIVMDYLDGGYDNAGTEVEVRFDPVEGGTRVTIEHRGWTALPPTAAGRSRSLKRWGWTSTLGWYAEWVFWGSPLRVASKKG
jgi:hypothetical protein